MSNGLTNSQHVGVRLASLREFLRIPTRPRSKMFHFQSMPRMKSNLKWAGTGDTWICVDLPTNQTNVVQIFWTFPLSCLLFYPSQTWQATQSCLQRQFSLETKTADLIYFRVNNDLLQFLDHWILFFPRNFPTSPDTDNKLACNPQQL